MLERDLVGWIAPPIIGILTGLAIVHHLQRENKPRKEPEVVCRVEAQREVCVGPARLLPFDEGGNLSGPQ